MVKSSIPVLGLVAWSGSGKTTLLCQLLAYFKAQGKRVGMIKHAHHDVEFDNPHKDSYKLRKSGASQMLLATAKRWALMVDLEVTEAEPNLQQMLDQLDQKKLDFILVEGFKHSHFNKIEVHRSTLKKPFIYPKDEHIIAVITDKPAEIQDRTTLDLNDLHQISDFILTWVEKNITSFKEP